MTAKNDPIDHLANEAMFEVLSTLDTEEYLNRLEKSER